MVIFQMCNMGHGSFSDVLACSSVFATCIGLVAATCIGVGGVLFICRTPFICQRRGFFAAEALALAGVDCLVATVPAGVALMSCDFDALVLEVRADFFDDVSGVKFLLPFLGVVVAFFDALASGVAAAFCGVKLLLVDFSWRQLQQLSRLL